MRFGLGILVVFILVFGFFLYLRRVDFDKRKTVEIFNDQNQLVVRFNCEIADTSAKRAKGLMFRKDLPENQGMFFIFPSEKKHTFWMMNTYIPLDIIFADKDFKIVGIIENAEPKSVKPLSVDKPSKYIIEINAGLVKKYGIKLGDELIVSNSRLVSCTRACRVPYLFWYCGGTAVSLRGGKLKLANTNI